MKRTKRKRWYGVYANNGFGVYNNFEKYLRASGFMNGAHIQGFEEKEDAEDFAAIGFVNLHGIKAQMQIIGDLENMHDNYFYFFRKGGGEKCEDR